MCFIIMFLINTLLLIIRILDEQKYKNKFQRKKYILPKYIENGRFESDFILLEKLITEFNDLIFSTKTLYYENLAKKLNNPLL